MNEIKSFTLYREFFKLINTLKPLEKRDEFVGQILDFYFKDKEPVFENDSDEEAIWENISRPIRQYKINALNGLKGGRPKTETITEMETESITEMESEMESTSKIVNVNSYSNKFIKPNIEEIRKYIKEERRSNVDPQKFYDFYESKGWMVGKNKMKDWKACVRTWEQRQDGQAPLPNFVGKEYKKEKMTEEEEKELREKLEEFQ
jgi:hypothetical protein